MEESVKGCDYVLHVASPVFAISDNNKEIEMAVNGTKFTLNACLKFNVKKVVITSSISAMIHDDFEQDENSWF